MNKVINKRGISLVALIITIIVMIILTAAVVVTGINTPRNTEYAIKMHNQAVVQDAVTLYIMTEMLNGIDDYTVSSPAGTKAPDVEEIVAQLYNVTTNKWVVANTETGEKGAVAKLGINLTEAELQANFTLDSKGVVGWVAGKEPTRETDEENNQQQPTKTLSSIAITTQPTTKEYEVGDTVDMTGLVVTATYSDGSEEDVTSSVTYTPALTEVTQTPGTKEITVTYSEKIATEKITITVVEATTATTLGSLITGPSMYGTTVTGYTAGLTGYEVSDWSVFYEDTTNGYVYLIASNVLTEAQIPDITGATKGTYSSGGYGILKWSSEPAVQAMSSNSIFKAQWSNYATYGNGKCVSALLNTNNWTAFATPSDTTLTNKVVGAIGSPTAEMFTASWSAKNTTTPLTMTNINGSTTSTIGYYYNYNGSIATSHTGLTTTGNELYFPKYNGNRTYYWLASPSAADAYRLCVVDSDGCVSFNSYGAATYGVRPVVCLESDIPATVTANGIDI